MKVYAIRNCREYCPATPKTKIKSIPFKSAEMPYDSVCFKSNAVKGAGIGTVCGLIAMGLLSAFSGGLATPAAYGLYAAAGGVAGGFAGSAVDNKESNDDVDS